jgi:hypothetical protein
VELPPKEAGIEGDLATLGNEPQFMAAFISKQLMKKRQPKPIFWL